MQENNNEQEGGLEPQNDTSGVLPQSVQGSDVLKIMHRQSNLLKQIIETNHQNPNSLNTSQIARITHPQDYYINGSGGKGDSSQSQKEDRTSISHGKSDQENKRKESDERVEKPISSSIINETQIGTECQIGDQQRQEHHQMNQDPSTIHIDRKIVQPQAQRNRISQLLTQKLSQANDQCSQQIQRELRSLLCHASPPTHNNQQVNDGRAFKDASVSRICKNQQALNLNHIRTQDTMKEITHQLIQQQITYQQKGQQQTKTKQSPINLPVHLRSQFLLKDIQQLGMKSHQLMTNERMARIKEMSGRPQSTHGQNGDLQNLTQGQFFEQKHQKPDILQLLQIQQNQQKQAQTPFYHQNKFQPIQNQSENAVTENLSKNNNSQDKQACQNIEQMQHKFQSIGDQRTQTESDKQLMIRQLFGRVPPVSFGHQNQINHNHQEKNLDHTKAQINAINQNLGQEFNLAELRKKPSQVQQPLSAGLRHGYCKGTSSNLFGVAQVGGYKGTYGGYQQLEQLRQKEQMMFRTPQMKENIFSNNKKFNVPKFDPDSIEFQNMQINRRQTNDFTILSDFKNGSKFDQSDHVLSKSDKKPNSKHLWKVQRQNQNYQQSDKISHDMKSTSKVSRQSLDKKSKLEDIFECRDENEVISYQPCTSKTFQGIPSEWHQTIKVRNPDTQRIKLYFKCMYKGCDSIFKKSCNLRDHFRKHTGQRPFKCSYCDKTFTQSGNLGRHLKNVHQITRDINEIQKENLDVHANAHNENAIININTDSESQEIKQKALRGETEIQNQVRRSTRLGKRKMSSTNNLINSQDVQKDFIEDNCHKRPRRSSVNYDQNDDLKNQMTTIQDHNKDGRNQDKSLMQLDYFVSEENKSDLHKKLKSKNFGLVQTSLAQKSNEDRQAEDTIFYKQCRKDSLSDNQIGKILLNKRLSKQIDKNCTNFVHPQIINKLSPCNYLNQYNKVNVLINSKQVLNNQKPNFVKCAQNPIKQVGDINSQKYLQIQKLIQGQDQVSLKQDQQGSLFQTFVPSFKKNSSAVLPTPTMNQIEQEKLAIKNQMLQILYMSMQNMQNKNKTVAAEASALDHRSKELQQESVNQQAVSMNESGLLQQEMNCQQQSNEYKADDYSSKQHEEVDNHQSELQQSDHDGDEGKVVNVKQSTSNVGQSNVNQH